MKHDAVIIVEVLYEADILSWLGAIEERNASSWKGPHDLLFTHVELLEWPSTRLDDFCTWTTCPRQGPNRSTCNSSRLESWTNIHSFRCLALMTFRPPPMPNLQELEHIIYWFLAVCMRHDQLFSENKKQRPFQKRSIFLFVGLLAAQGKTLFGECVGFGGAVVICVDSKESDVSRRWIEWPVKCGFYLCMNESNVTLSSHTVWQSHMQMIGRTTVASNVVPHNMR